MSKDRNTGNILVALSGGVDSAVAAALLVQKGHRVTGVHLKFWSEYSNDEKRANICCSSESEGDAKKTCDMLGIPFVVWDVGEFFFEKVVQDFLAVYESLGTPNPCIVCNQHIKFGYLVQKAKILGFDALATGHWARVERDSGREQGYNLLRATNIAKDQSYFLYRLDAKDLSFIHFPLGGFKTKDEVRQIAKDLKLPVADKHDSNEVCFIPDGDKKGFLTRWLPQGLTKGEVTDTNGKILGQHEGLALYTEGQRKGIGIAGGDRMYVVQKDSSHNTLILGSRSQTRRRGVVAVELNWLAKPKGSQFSCQCRVRYNGVLIDCSAKIDSGNIEVDFAQELEGIAAGQSIVFYDGDQVLGGGLIQSAIE